MIRCGEAPLGQRETYDVCFANSEWIVGFQGKPLGTYENRSEAVGAAVTVAKAAARAGADTTVVIQEPDGSLHPLWQSDPRVENLRTSQSLAIAKSP
jgi:hypothetical protein